MSTLDFFGSRLVSVTAWMAVAALVVQLLLWLVRPISPLVHRLAWACVILSGVFFVRMPIRVSEHQLAEAVPKPLQVLVAPISETSRRFERFVDAAPSIPADRFSAELGLRANARVVERAADFRNPMDISQLTSDGKVAVSEWTWRCVAALVWGFGTVAVLGLNFSGYIRFVRCTRRMRAASAEMSREWDDLLVARNVGRAIPILVSDTFGPAFCLTPAGYRLIIPENRWKSLSQVERLGILRHELAHFERSDLFKSLLVRCVVVLHWFNPAAWWAQRQFERAGEWACDDVAGGRDGRVEFAKVLMQLGGARFPSVPLADAVAGGPIHNRIRRLLSLSSIADRRWKASLIAALSVAVLALALVRINRVADAASDRATPAASPALSSVAASSNDEESNLGPLADPGLVKGQVLDADGKTPVAQATVMLQLGGWMEQTQSDAKGNFHFDKQRDEWYHVWASKGKLVSNKERIQNSDQADSPKSRFPTVRLVMRPARQLEMKVTSKETGRPIAGSRVRLEYPDRRIVQTNSVGTARVEGLLPEKQEIVAEAAGFARWQGEIELGNSADSSAYAISLDPGGSVEGTVVDENGRPVPRAWMDARLAGNSDYLHLDSPQTDRVGRFHDDYLPLNVPLQFSPSHHDYLRCEPQEFTLTAQKPKVQLHFVLKRRPHLSVEGNVTDERGQPLAAATVYNHGQSSNQIQKTTTDEHGKFAFADLLESGSDFAIDVRAKRFAPEHAVVHPVAGSSPTHVTVKLKPGHLIHGRVVSEDGKPISYANVHFNSPGFSWGMEDDSTRTDDQGRFELDTLPSLCSFQIGHPGYENIFNGRLPIDQPHVVTVTMSRTWTLRGHVFASDTGKPIEQFDVSHWGLRSTTFRSHDGLFALKDLSVIKNRDGRVLYNFSVQADGFQPKSLEQLLRAQGPSDAILQIPLERVDASKLTSVSGRIVDADDRPVAGANLRLIVTSQQPVSDHDNHYNWILIKSDQLAQRHEWCDQYLRFVSDADGKFEFKDLLAGKFLQLAYWGKHVPQGRSLAFDKTEPQVAQRITIKLPRPATIRGTLDLASLPNAGEVTASLDREVFNDQRVRLTAGLKSFEFTDLLPGNYTVTVMSKVVPSKNEPGFGVSTTLASWKVRLKPGETADLKFSDAKIEPAVER